ncbi:hypothetical protein [Streptomyces sp. NPDC055036]
MTLAQLLTLADQHRYATSASGPAAPEPSDGESLLGFAAMRRT